MTCGARREPSSHHINKSLEESTGGLRGKLCDYDGLVLATMLARIVETKMEGSVKFSLISHLRRSNVNGLTRVSQRSIPPKVRDVRVLSSTISLAATPDGLSSSLSGCSTSFCGSPLLAAAPHHPGVPLFAAVPDAADAPHVPRPPDARHTCHSFSFLLLRTQARADLLRAAHAAPRHAPAVFQLISHMFERFFLVRRLLPDFMCFEAFHRFSCQILHILQEYFKFAKNPSNLPNTTLQNTLCARPCSPDCSRSGPMATVSNCPPSWANTPRMVCCCSQSFLASLSQTTASKDSRTRWFRRAWSRQHQSRHKTACEHSKACQRVLTSFSKTCAPLHHDGHLGHAATVGFWNGCRPCCTRRRTT